MINLLTWFTEAYNSGNASGLLFSLLFCYFCCTLGCWIFPNFKLYADKIQSDPFAPASLFRVIMDQDVAGYPAFTSR